MTAARTIPTAHWRVVVAVTMTSLLAWCTALPLPTRNAFHPDDVLAVHVDAGSSTAVASADGTLLLANVTIWHFSKVDPAVIRRYRLPTAANGEQFPCTLPFETPRGILSPRSLGQLTLSADMRFVALACYGHSPGTRLNEAPIKVVALLGADLLIDTSTAAIMPAQDPFAAATDNGTTFWLGGAFGLVTFASGGSAQPVALLGPDTPISALSVMNGTTLLATAPANSTVLQLSGCASGSPLMVACLPRELPMSVNRWFPSGTGTPLAHSRGILARGPDPAGQGTVFGSSQWGDAASVLAVADAQHPGYNVALYLVNDTAGGVAVPMRHVTISSQLDVTAVAVVANRFANATWEWRNVARGITYAPTVATASLYACSRVSVYNFTVTESVQQGFDTLPVTILHHIPEQRKRSQRFVGVSLAPFDISLPTAALTPQPTPTTTSSTDWSPTPSASYVPVSASASPRVNYSDIGTFVGPLLVRAEKSLLVLRVGSAADPRGANVPPERARPLFIDVIDRGSGVTLASLPLPTARSGAQHACTGSLRAFFLKLRMSSYLTRFVTLPCFDVEAYAGDIWLAASPTPQPRSAPPATPAASSASFVPVPVMVAAQVHALGYVDTVTIISNRSNCAHAVTNTVIMAPERAGRFFYTGAQDLADAPVEDAGKCGIRFVPRGNAGSDDVPLTPGSRGSPRESAFMLTLLQTLFSLTPGIEDMSLVCFACGRFVGASGA
jgi:hypothetical protein